MTAPLWYDSLHIFKLVLENSCSKKRTLAGQRVKGMVSVCLSPAGSLLWIRGVGAVQGQWQRRPRHAAWLGTQPAPAHRAALPAVPTPLC